jgi:hypothetical protein
VDNPSHIIDIIGPGRIGQNVLKDVLSLPRELSGFNFQKFKVVYIKLVVSIA